MTIWTLVVFSVSLVVLTKAVFPKIREALDKRQAVIEESMNASKANRALRSALSRRDVFSRRDTECPVRVPGGP